METRDVVINVGSSSKKMFVHQNFSLRSWGKNVGNASDWYDEYRSLLDNTFKMIPKRSGSQFDEQLL